MIYLILIDILYQYHEQAIFVVERASCLLLKKKPKKVHYFNNNIL